eukprot:2653475-Alexandrium_andersonii.AAC.1
MGPGRRCSGKFLGQLKAPSESMSRQPSGGGARAPSSLPTRAAHRSWPSSPPGRARPRPAWPTGPPARPPGRCGSGATPY